MTVVIGAVALAASGLAGALLVGTGTEASGGKDVVLSSPTSSYQPTLTTRRPASETSTTTTVPPPRDGAWIAQLASVSHSSANGQLESILARIRVSAPEAEVLDSNEYASLRPGYWVVYSRGPFPSAMAALAFCDDHGWTHRNQCLARFLSHNAADFQRWCFRNDAGALVEGCKPT